MTSNSTDLVHSLSFWWRVSRYDPALRDERGAYQVETWTSVADVGNRYDGHELILAEYERVESLYLAAFVAFANESGVEHLQIRDLERGNGLEEGAILTLHAATGVVGRMLREDVICKLEAPSNRFALHVGFDLYMYVGSSNWCPDAMRHARELGLYVEPDWPSPQLLEGDE